MFPINTKTWTFECLLFVIGIHLEHTFQYIPIGIVQIKSKRDFLIQVIGGVIPIGIV